MPTKDILVELSLDIVIKNPFINQNDLIYQTLIILTSCNLDKKLDISDEDLEYIENSIKIKILMHLTILIKKLYLKKIYYKVHFHDEIPTVKEAKKKVGFDINRCLKIVSFSYSEKYIFVSLLTEEKLREIDNTGIFLFHLFLIQPFSLCHLK